MTRGHVDIIIGKMANKPGAGIILLKRLRTLVRYAMALGWTDRDPASGVKGYRSKEIHTWNEDEIAQFERYWSEGSRQRRAFALLLYTGQLGSDVHRMLWSDLVADTIQVAQQKTKTKLIIPLHESLSRELSITERNQETILTTSYGKPFTVKGFGKMVSEAIREAGLPSRCVAHGGGRVTKFPKKSTSLWLVSEGFDAGGRLDHRLLADSYEAGVWQVSHHRASARQAIEDRFSRWGRGGGGPISSF